MNSFCLFFFLDWATVSLVDCCPIEDAISIFCSNSLSVISLSQPLVSTDYWIFKRVKRDIYETDHVSFRFQLHKELFLLLCHITKIFAIRVVQL